ncbi:ADP-ribosylglycohydrolase family protein [Nocardioides caldifontis]|uniref:ADP-ribosylglycohydrolase family protein n=1 Tax=Nocardioides caldifontis TaxID=2588938 RepID=UPI0011DF434C|nr:ADP-ribosylglycohydrolase family protein [Nocardioides caldifontis]
MRLASAQTDRAAGVLLGAAVGDALGAGYEFGTARLAPDEQPRMIGGGLGGFEPGEWTDDTAQTWAVAEVAATGADLRTDEALTDVARGFARWYAEGPPDVGVQTSRVLGSVGRQPTAGALRDAARDVLARTGRAGGNGSLMRTSPVALAHVDDASATAEAAVAVSELTHADPRAGEACVLWCLAIRHAVLEGELDVRAGLPFLDADARTFWEARIDEAESMPPSTFRPNGYVVTALQAAWSAIVSTPVADAEPHRHLVDALATAIHIGDDTDTVASIAGALLGARWGSSAVPAEWRRVVHGWPGRTARQLVDLAMLTINGGRPDSYGWPGVSRVDYHGWTGNGRVTVHPDDDRVYLAGISALDDLPADVTAVVSLCRTGGEHVPGSVTHIDFRLVDSTAADNPNLAYVIDDAARTVQALRDEGHTVLLHCVAGQSRTPTVAARYSMLRAGVSADEALDKVCAALPDPRPNEVLVRALRKLDGLRREQGDDRATRHADSGAPWKTSVRCHDT